MPSDAPTPSRDAGGASGPELSPRARQILEQVDRIAALGRERLGQTRPRRAASQSAEPPPAPNLGSEGAGLQPEAVEVGTPQAPPIPQGWSEPDSGSPLLELIDTLGGRAELMRDELDDLRLTLDQLAARLPARPRTGISERPTAAPAVQLEAPPTVVRRPVAEPPAAATIPRAGVAPMDSARLVAIEMAVAGRTRDDVAQRLRKEFRLGDPDPILDDVFGPGTAGETRMPWGPG